MCALRLLQTSAERPQLQEAMGQGDAKDSQALERGNAGPSKPGGEDPLQLRWLARVEASLCVEIALGVVPPAGWTTGTGPGYRRPMKKTEREALRTELVATAAPYLDRL